MPGIYKRLARSLFFFTFLGFVFFWSHGTLNKFSLHFSSSAFISFEFVALRRSTLQKAPAAAPQKPPPHRSWWRRAETMEGTEAEILRKPHVLGGKTGATWVYQYIWVPSKKNLYQTYIWLFMIVDVIGYLGYLWKVAVALNFMF